MSDNISQIGRFLRDETVIARFWGKVSKEGNGGCWIWTRGSGRYGQFTLRHGKSIGAHRFSWQLHFGEIPLPTILVCHTCDVTKCINPTHLFLGSNADNSADMVAKNRSMLGYTRPGTGPAGVRNSHCKLSEEIVAKIRLHRKNYTTPVRELAKLFDVSKSQIFNIVSEAHWKGMPSVG